MSGESLGDVFAQLLSGATWREGLATSGYALCNLLTGGRAFREQSKRPGFRESQGSWAVGGIAAAGAACLVAAPVVASNPMYIAWMAGTLGGTGAAGAAASDAIEGQAGGYGSLVLNIAGEGEVPGAINVQGPWVFQPGWQSSYGQTLQELEAEGHLFQQVERMDQLPYGTGTVDTIYTNSVPIGGMGRFPLGYDHPILGPYPQMPEILRILSESGKWLHNGVEVPR